MDITNQIFEPRFRMMEPEFEDMIFGIDLENGMIILLEDTLMKGDPEHINSDYDKQRLLECNRWCEVTQLSFMDRGPDDPLVKFMALYPDGAKIPRTYSASYAWIVKKNVEMDLGE